jgi:hypothetical protein
MKHIREAKARSRAVVPLKKKKKKNGCETWALTLRV